MQPTLSKAPVNAVLHANGEVRMRGSLARLADGSGRVRVQFGVEKVFEQAVGRPPDDVEYVQTPPTPTPRTPSPSTEKT